MRRFALTIAILSFLALAAIALSCEVPVFHCAWRALVGAVVIYVVVSTGGRIVLSIMVDAVVNSAPQRGDEDLRP